MDRIDEILYLHEDGVVEMADGGRIGFKEAGLVEKGPNKGKYFARTKEGGERVRKFFNTKSEFDSFMKLRESKKVNVSNLKKVAKDLKQELGRLPTQTEVARKADSNIAAVKRHLNENTDFAMPMSKQEAAKMGGKPIENHIVLADDTKGIKELQNKINKLNRQYNLSDKGVKFTLDKTAAGNYTPGLKYNAREYREAFGREKSFGSLNKLIDEFKQFQKTDAFKNYSKSATMKAGGVKSAKKQLTDLGSKKEDVFKYLLNNKNTTIQQIAKDLKLPEGSVTKNLQGLYTDIYKRVGDEGAVYLKEFSANQLDSVHNSIKNTKVPLKDRVRNLVIDAYKGDENLKPLLKKLDDFYNLQSEIKKTPYGKFFSANLDHPVPLNFIRELEKGVSPMDLIRVRPIPEFLNQRAFKAQFDRVLGTAYRTGNKKALEAIVNVQSYLPQEFGGITKTGKITDYGAKPFSLKTNLSQTDFPKIYERVFDFIKNPELQETFKQSKVSFKNLAAQEKTVIKQIGEIKKGVSQLKGAQLGTFCRAMSAAGFATGGNVTASCLKAIDDNPARAISAAAKISKPTGTLKNVVSLSKTLAKGTGYALLGELAIAAPIALYQYGKGESAKRMIGDATYGLAGQNIDDEKKEFMGEEGFKAHKLVDDLGQLDNLTTEFQDSETIMMPEDEELTIQQMNKKEKDIAEGLQSYENEDGSFNRDKFNRDFDTGTAGLKNIEDVKGFRRDVRRDEDYDVFEDEVMAAGGGLITLKPRRPNALPPESGPNSQGLENLKYYVTNT